MIDTLFSQHALFFSIPALLGSVVFLMKLALMTLGADADVDTDVDLDLGDAAAATDSDAAFTLLSIQSIAAFLMGFGWGGLGGVVGLDWTLAPSVLLGVGCGAGLMWLLGLMLKAIYDLQESGNVHIDDATGHAGTVYASIPPHGGGHGQVRVVIRDHARIYEAITNGEALPTNTPVQVTDVGPGRTLVVQPV
ncbi:MAG: hypothetical protein HKO59_02100 [Phycisphaerales bacterium]|nr:hypothetical protein [Phycisphaerae bacterium]NNF44116.1 hypothetical protein [Phycisphaerales bacterium]NNM24774.1 hypothetical protein [Phycisphaerales bacterium]